jgi:hypothetical protein
MFADDADIAHAFIERNIALFTPHADQATRRRFPLDSGMLQRLLKTVPNLSRAFVMGLHALQARDAQGNSSSDLDLLKQDGQDRFFHL